MGTKDKHNNKPDSVITQESFDDKFKASSTTECTGVIPSRIKDESEADSYTELYDLTKQRPQEDHPYNKKPLH